MKIYLETDRLYLREFDTKDTEKLLELDSDPKVMKWLTNGQVGNLEKINDMMNRVEELLEKHSRKMGVWAVIRKSDQEFLGWFHLRPCKKDPDNISKLELGYRFFRKFWGKGYATEGSMALVDKAFNELESNEVFATAMKKNLASLKVLEKIGFQFKYEYYDDRFPVKDEIAVYYSLSKKDWSQKIGSRV